MTTLQILLFGLVAASAEIIGGTLLALRKEWPRKIQEYLIALSAGFLLSLVFIDLIPESLHLVGGTAPLYVLLGFGILHFFEHTIVGHLHFGEEKHAEVMISPLASMSAFAGLFVHAFFDGFSIAAAMLYDPNIGMLVFIAVLLHKLPEGLTISSIILAAKQPRKNAIVASFAIGTATMLGVVMVFFLSSIDPRMAGIALALSAGAATYVGASDLIPEVNRSEHRIIPLVFFVGILLYYTSHVMLER